MSEAEIHAALDRGELLRVLIWVETRQISTETAWRVMERRSRRQARQATAVSLMALLSVPLLYLLCVLLRAAAPGGG